MEYWNHIYEHFNPIAFSFFVEVHWYGLMYVLALLSALGAAKYFIVKDHIALSAKELGDYFVYIEIGIILGARLGYIIFYDPHTSYYLTHPWQIFNPFNADGEFVGIRGMSYHGAAIGWFLGSYLFHRVRKSDFGLLMDLVAISVPLGFVFGRIGNFLNQELVGRATDVPWGIYVDGVLRHPSQLYEAVLEGLLVFLVIFFYRNYKRYSGELILVYGFMYAFGRFVAEFFRAPDPQLGYLTFGLTMGQILSSVMMLLAVILWIVFYRLAKKRGALLR